jgi:ribonucleoside-diphosphate reductase beta chain
MSLISQMAIRRRQTWMPASAGMTIIRQHDACFRGQRPKTPKHRRGGQYALRHTYKPFEYPWAYEYWKRQQQLHWLPEEVPLGEDCRDWAQKLTDHERNLLTQIFRFFTQADVEVQDCYHEKYGRVFKPTEIKMMLTAFSNMETVHIAAYSHLLDTIGMPETEYSAFLQYKEMKDKHDYLSTFGVDTDEDIAKTLAMFGGFTEGLQLFASFAMLMNFPRFNKMKGMGQIVTWSSATRASIATASSACSTLSPRSGTA